MSPPILRMVGIRKSFPGVLAVSRGDIELRSGEIHALVGANGAGKSTFIKVLTGVLQPDTGEIAIDGQAVKFRTPIDARRAGISAIYQEFALVPALSVHANLLLGREPARAGFIKPDRWPAWEIGYDEIMAAPEATVGGKPEITVSEAGPARVALTISRGADNSAFETTLSLAAGSAGDCVVFDEAIEWYERETLLKASFPLSTANEKVTYDLGLGAIERGLNHAKLYEVPAHQWADMTAPDGSYGVAVLSNCRYGWDHPDSTTLRLSLIHTPGVFDSWSWVGDQKSQDNGHHHLSYAVSGHRGDWRRGDVVRQAARFNQPLLAFQTVPHTGTAGNQFSLLLVEMQNAQGEWSTGSSNSGVMVNAVKKAEDSNEIVIRLRETNGQSVPMLRVRCACPILSAREINGAEEPVGDAMVADGALITSLGPYRPRAFALTLDQASAPHVPGPDCQPLALPCNLDGISTDDNRRDGDFENGRTLAGELLPDTLTWLDMPFTSWVMPAGVPASKPESIRWSFICFKRKATKAWSCGSTGLTCPGKWSRRRGCRTRRR